MEQKENILAYKIFKTILGPIYKLWYNPKIIGKENIPKDGRFIIVGNHIHIMDQCNVIISTKRYLHYMAKKEYFDGKFAWFFRSCACIPVDRSKKDDEATHSALEVLEKNEALGLFPEGTRNGMKEERMKELYDKYFQEEPIEYNDFQNKLKNNKTSFVNYLEELMVKEYITRDEFIDNLCDADNYMKILLKEKRITEDEYYEHILLPLKFGAVSMAKKTNSLLVPFVITGDYKFRSKNLLVRIGKPIEVSEDLEKSNKELDEIMKNMIRENHKINGK